jgi:signal transduction histidine kinase
VSRLKQSFSFDSLVISGIVGQTETVLHLFCDGAASRVMPAGLQRPVADSIVEFFVSHGATAVSLDEAATAGDPVTEFTQAQSMGIKRVIGCPLVMHGKTLGVIQLWYTDEHEDSGLEVLQSLAPLIAPMVALKMAELDGKRNEETAKILEFVARSVAGRKELNSICQKFFEFVKLLIGFDGAQVRLASHPGDTHVVNYAAGLFDLFAADVPLDHVRDELIARGLLAREPFLLDDAVLGSHDIDGLHKTLDEIPSILIAPLVNGDEFLGTLELFSVNEYAYTSEDVNHASHIASLLTGAIANLKLYTDLEAQLEIRKFLAEVARLASSGRSLEDTVKKITEALSQVMHFEHAMFVLPQDVLRVSVGASKPRNVLPELVSIVAETADSAFACQLDGHDRRSSSRSGRVHCIHGPLWEESSTSGKGELHLHRSSNSFSEAERHLLSDFSRHIAPALDSVISHHAALEVAEQKRRAERAEAEASRLSQINDSKRQFLTTVSHELRTPLTPIRAFVDVLAQNKTGNLTPRQEQQLTVIKRNVTWLNMLIEDLLDVSRIESGRFALQIEQFEVKDTIEQLTESLMPMIEGTGHTFKLIAPDKAITVAGDANRISQVLGNLINNSIKYSPADTLIRLLVRVANGKIWFYVRDEGPGIPRDQQDGLFHMFGRANTELTRSVPGTGIGLYISKKIVEAHGGEIKLVSEPGSHTTVWFWVPVKAQEAEALAEAA